jgi:hypothetical protein
MKTRLPGVLLALLSIAIGVIPLVTQCDSTTMRCHWTAHAALVVAVPLFLVGVLTVLARRKETQLGLGLLATVLGGLAALLPGVLFGVCQAAMSCRTIMRPSLILLGSLTVVVGLGTTAAVALRRAPRDAG